jgi:hypothetical protein
MRILKLTTNDGSEFYDDDYSPGMVDVLERRIKMYHGGLKRAELVTMTIDEYRNMAARVQWALLFGADTNGKAA